MQKKLQKQQRNQNNMAYAIDIIKKYEGCRLSAYKCPAQVWTVGYGATVYPDGTKVKEGDTITQEKAEALLLDYVINKIMPNIRDLGLSSGQEAALCSLIYNIGWPAFAKSKCYKAIKEKDWETVFKNWDWCKGGGKFLKGLAKRRTEEMFLFFQDL